jgi:hypothetical protein
VAAHVTQRARRGRRTGGSNVPITIARWNSGDMAEVALRQRLNRTGAGRQSGPLRRDRLGGLVHEYVQVA